MAINRFPTDTDTEIQFIQEHCQRIGVQVVLSTVWADGSKGAEELAKVVVEMCNQDIMLQHPYQLEDSLEIKIINLAKRIYGASDVHFTLSAINKLKKIEDMGYQHLPICCAKTQYSFSDDSKLLGRPEDFIFYVKDVKLSAGAGFVVVYSGDIMTMPGLPKVPAANQIDIDQDGKISGLF